MNSKKVKEGAESALPQERGGGGLWHLKKAQAS